MSVFLGQGTYGQVWTPPPILCQNIKDLDKTKKYVGKLSFQNKTTNLKTALDLQQKRKRMDPAVKYTIPFIGHCKKKTHAQKEWKPYPNRNIQFVYEYGGKSWDKWVFKKKNAECFQLLFLSFRNIVHGLELMNKAGIAHMDIKLPNIVYDLDTNTSKLIDYDLMISQREIYDLYYRQHEHDDIIYYAWPPEINFIYNVREPLSNLSNDEILENYIHLPGYLQTHILNDIRKYSLSNSYREKFVDHEKLDIYGLGMAFAELFGNVDPDIWNLTQQMIRADPRQRIDTLDLIQKYEILYKKFITSRNKN